MAKVNGKKGIVISAETSRLRILPFVGGREESYPLFPRGEYKIEGMPVHLYDCVKIDKRGRITRLDENTEIEMLRSNGKNRDRLKAAISFVPLAYSLYPKTAKAKNLVLAKTTQFGYIPIMRKNNYMKHCIYIGNAIYYLNKNPDEKKVSELYSTGWFLYDDGIPASIEYLRNHFQFYTGVIVDSSLADVFLVFNEKTGLLSMRKDICAEQNLAVGNWIEFIQMIVDEAEKSDETQEIYPDDAERMTVFNDRRIAIHPMRSETPYPTMAKSEEEIEIIYEFNAPFNPSYKAAYKIPLLGEFVDEKDLIDLKYEDSILMLAIRSRVVNYQSVEFVLAEIIDAEKKPNSPIGLQNTPSPAQTTPSPDEFLRQSRRNVTMSNGDANTRMPSATIERKSMVPTNSISIHGIVIDKVKRGREEYVLVFSNDYALREKIVRLSCRDMDPLPNLADWIEIVMKKTERSRGHADFIVWSAKKRESLYETYAGAGNNILVRAPLKMSDEGFYNKELGKISNIGRRVNTSGLERQTQTVFAWCQKIEMTSEDYRFNNCHWEIAPTPDADWQNLPSPEVQTRSGPALIPTKIGFIGSRYRKAEDVADI